MNRYLLILSSLLFSFSAFSQTDSKVTHQINNTPKGLEYYIYLSGVNTREDVLSIEKNISSKPGVLHFRADRFPVRCFRLISSQPIDEKTFSHWIGSSYKILSYGIDAAAKERAYLLYQKNRNTKS